MASAPHADVDSLNVVHQIPGRLRVRVPAEARAAGLVDAVTALPGVVSASWSPRTRGLLVVYDRGVGDPSAILRAIAEHSGVEPSVSAPRSGDTPPTLAAAVTSLAQDVNTRVTRASGGMVTLGVLLPLALTVWAGREILRGRTAPLAWTSALWYAHGLFRDYSVPSREG